MNLRKATVYHHEDAAWISSEAPAQAASGTPNDCNCSNKQNISKYKNQRNDNSVDKSTQPINQSDSSKAPTSAIFSRSGTRKNFRRDRADLSLLPPEHLGHGALGWRTSPISPFVGPLEFCRRFCGRY